MMTLDAIRSTPSRSIARARRAGVDVRVHVGEERQPAAVAPILRLEVTQAVHDHVTTPCDTESGVQLRRRSLPNTSKFDYL